MKGLEGEAGGGWGESGVDETAWGFEEGAECKVISRYRILPI